jgi:hypothetical protein
MTKIYILLLLLATTVVSITGALFSVSGLAELFSGSKFSVMAMAGSLEFSKFIVVGFIYRYWGHIHAPLRNYLLFAVGTLMIITSVGIFGYLSNAYQVAAGDLNLHLLEIENLEVEAKQVEDQIAELRTFVDNIPVSRISKKFEFQKSYEPRFDELRKRQDGIIKQANEKRRSLLSLNTKIGPIVHVAKAVGLSVDTTVNMLITIFVLVFDPLAVSLVFCLNILIRLREKYRGNEVKIGKHAFTSPVDHRYAKGKDRRPRSRKKSKPRPPQQNRPSVVFRKSA